MNAMNLTVTRERNPGGTESAEFRYNSFLIRACGNCRGALQLCQDQLGLFLKCANCARETPVPT